MTKKQFEKKVFEAGGQPKYQGSSKTMFVYGLQKELNLVEIQTEFKIVIVN